MFTLSTTLAHAAVKANVKATRKSQSRRGAVKVAAQAPDASSRREAMSLIAVRPNATTRSSARCARPRATRDARDDAGRRGTTRGLIVERTGARGRGETRARRVEDATRATSSNEILTIARRAVSSNAGRDDARDVQAGVRGVR
jgi:hypothetical protein